MKIDFKLLVILMLIIQGCNESKDENIRLYPNADYPYTYTTLSQPELAGKVKEFDAINTFETLRLNEFGMLSGNVPVDMDAGIDASTVKKNISFVIKTYAHFLGITNSDSINIDQNISIHLKGGVDVTLIDYFQSGLQTTPVFVLHQAKLNNRKIENAEISFYFLPQDNQMVILGRWYPRAYIPAVVIKNQQDALNLAVQYINENHKEVTPLSLANVEKEKFNRVIFPYPTEKGVEMRECWEVIFWDNAVETLVDTQTGEIIYYLDYGHMI